MTGFGIIHVGAALPFLVLALLCCRCGMVRSRLLVEALLRDPMLPLVVGDLLRRLGTLHDGLEVERGTLLLVRVAQLVDDGLVAQLDVERVAEHLGQS